MMLVYPEGSVVVDNTDTFALVNQLSKMTYHPVIAYFGDPLFPGGDVTNGENLFEHKLFRRSSISNTLRADMFYPLQTMDEAI